MIKIKGKIIKPEELFKQISNREQKAIIKQLVSYNVIYEYESVQQLKFELLFRVNILKAATELNNSGAKFTTFTYAFCNQKYWYRLNNGGFLLREDATPSNAILDILKSGSLYAFECSTAIAIVLYIAVLHTIGPSAFNAHFKGLYLMDWEFDEDLPVYTHVGEDYLIGDSLHFKNPDFDPEQPHWRGENAIFFGDDKFYGHGIGITNSSTIINFLNKKRKKNPKESAFLMRHITRPHYKALYLLKMNE